MHIFHNPKWLQLNMCDFNHVENTSYSIFDMINEKLERLLSNEPLASIVIPAWNEEENILNCILSLSNMITSIPFEIIIVNNNSSDNTQLLIDRINVKSFFQPIEGCGPARQMGQEKALGKYILMADADCIYPACWLNYMINELEKSNVVCVYGRYSFIAQNGFPRWKLFLFERLKDIIAEVRHYKRPYLNSLGMSMAYIKELGLKIGFVNYKIRGEDGRMCFDLMRFGEIKQMKYRKARVWTKPRTLQLDGGFEKVLYLRVKTELSRFFSLMYSQEPHDTKTSKNE